MLLFEVIVCVVDKGMFKKDGVVEEMCKIDCEILIGCV